MTKLTIFENMYLKEKRFYLEGIMFLESIKRYSLVQVGNGNDQEMAQSERNSHSTNRGVGKNQNDT